MREISFFKNNAKNEAGRLVKYLSLFFRKVLYELKTSALKLSINILRQLSNQHTVKTNCIKLQTIDPKICSSLIFQKKIWQYREISLQRTSFIADSGCFSRERKKSWSNSHNKTSMQRTLYRGHLYMADTILRPQLDFSPITGLLIAERPKYWSNKTNVLFSKTFLFNLFQTTIYFLR